MYLLFLPVVSAGCMRSEIREGGRLGDGATRGGTSSGDVRSGTSDEFQRTHVGGSFRTILPNAYGDAHSCMDRHQSPMPTITHLLMLPRMGSELVAVCPQQARLD